MLPFNIRRQEKTNENWIEPNRKINWWRKVHFGGLTLKPWVMWLKISALKKCSPHFFWPLAECTVVECYSQRTPFKKSKFRAFRIIEIESVLPNNHSTPHIGGSSYAWGSGKNYARLCRLGQLKSMEIFNTVITTNSGWTSRIFQLPFWKIAHLGFDSPPPENEPGKC